MSNRTLKVGTIVYRTGMPSAAKGQLGTLARIVRVVCPSAVDPTQHVYDVERVGSGKEVRWSGRNLEVAPQQFDRVRADGGEGIVKGYTPARVLVDMGPRGIVMYRAARLGIVAPHRTDGVWDETLDSLAERLRTEVKALDEALALEQELGEAVRANRLAIARAQGRVEHARRALLQLAAPREVTF